MKNYLKALCTTAILFFLMFLGWLVVFNVYYFNPLETAIDNFHFSDIYFYWQKKNSDNTYSNIVIVNTAYLHDRDKIATVIDSINAHQPRLVAVDIIFPDAVSSLTPADSHLCAAFSACPKLVIAQRAVPISEKSWNMERSFFADGYTEGVVNFSTGLVRTIHTTETFDQVSYPTFAAQVVRQIGELPAEKERMIQFGGINFMTWNANEEDFTLDFLKDKIVFIGDINDIRDWHDIPIGTTGRSRMSGVELHALSTYTLLSPYHYHFFPKFVSIFIQIILIYFFCFCLHLWWPQTTMDNWVQFLLQIAFIAIIVIFCYILFRTCYIICSPTIAIIGFGLVGFAKNITDTFTDKEQRDKFVEKWKARLECLKKKKEK